MPEEEADMGEAYENLKQNLADAGCSPGLCEHFRQLGQNGDVHGQLRLLAAHKKKLLKAYHEEQRKIDCLDFLMFNLQQSLQENKDEKN